MSSISLRLPEFLHKKMRELAKKENASINQLVSSALAKKISAITIDEYIQARADRASKAKFRKALSKVKDISPNESDM